ncbi:hypothetical protein AV530_007283 [Patagioenas fasciata monilis]|uniref:Uncharacterized protein n=1 Tax=Patagioenas fasciata monilis TaxID=372326 RepID=A0A1V4JXH5_PATFA|nr:hypothetical protein AV530_007283 [Patagioenas fasciata monilis]
MESSLLFGLELCISSGKFDFCRLTPLFLGFCCEINAKLMLSRQKLWKLRWWSFWGSVAAPTMPEVESGHGKQAAVSSVLMPEESHLDAQPEDGNTSVSFWDLEVHRSPPKDL